MKTHYIAYTILLCVILHTKMSFAQEKSVSENETLCYELAQEKARELGGELAKITMPEATTQASCIAVILIPSKNGEHPQRVEVSLPEE